MLCSSFDDGAAIDTTTQVALDNGDALTPQCGGSPSLGVNVEGGSFPGLVNETTTFNPTGGANGTLPISSWSYVVYIGLPNSLKLL